MSNITPNGNFNNDSFLCALLQLRNTPDSDCNLSPAELSLATLCETLFRLLIGLPLFLIALFVVLGAKHSELKKMPFEALDFDQYNVKSGRITIGNRRLFRLMPDVAESQQISLPPTVPPDMKRSLSTPTLHAHPRW